MFLLKFIEKNVSHKPSTSGSEAFHHPIATHNLQKDIKELNNKLDIVTKQVEQLQFTQKEEAAKYLINTIISLMLCFELLKLAHTHY